MLQASINLLAHVCVLVSAMINVLSFVSLWEYVHDIIVPSNYQNTLLIALAMCPRPFLQLTTIIFFLFFLFLLLSLEDNCRTFTLYGLIDCFFLLFFLINFQILSVYLSHSLSLSFILSSLSLLNSLSLYIYLSLPFLLTLIVQWNLLFILNGYDNAHAYKIWI